MAKGDVREAVESGLAWEATARRAEEPACREGAEPRRLTLANMVARKGQCGVSVNGCGWS